MPWICDDHGYETGSEDCPGCLRVILANQKQEIEQMRTRISKAIQILQPQAEWDQAIPEGQGLPDGETYAHYVNTMGARHLIAILDGSATEAIPEKPSEPEGPGV